MSLHHGLTDLRDNNLTCFTDMLYSSMVLGNLPSQLDVLSTGQNYCEAFPNCVLTCTSMIIPMSFGSAKLNPSTFIVQLLQRPLLGCYMLVYPTMYDYGLSHHVVSCNSTLMTY